MTKEEKSKAVMADKMKVGGGATLYSKDGKKIPFPKPKKKTAKK